MQLTFDKSAIEFVLSTFGFEVVEGKVMYDGKQEKCHYCNADMNVDNLGGFLNEGFIARIVCSNFCCLIEASEREISEKD